MAARSNLEYSPLPDRAAEVVKNLFVAPEKVQAEVAKFRHVKPRKADQDGDTEVIDGVTFTHHFVNGPGDAEVVEWHYVETGPKDAEAVVFLHGIPDSWYQWHPQMVKLSKSYRCIAPDLKGYGQSGKAYGDYRHEGVGEQLFQMLHLIGVERFNLTTHDRGSAQGDFIVANHPDHVLRYARGEQHLFHFNPVLAPQGDIFAEAPYTGFFDDIIQVVCWVYISLCKKQVPDYIIERTIQEFSYPDIAKAVPRYFNSSTFRQEWLNRRNRLLAAWKCPVMILQGYDSKTQPREFYEGITKEHIPNAKSVKVEFIPGGHFWSLESPQETTQALETFFGS